MTIDEIAGDFRARAGEFTRLKARVMFDLGDEGSLVVDATEAPPQIWDEEHGHYHTVGS